jgi:hypothetical protein
MTRKDEYQEKRQKLAELTAHFRKIRSEKSEAASTPNEGFYWAMRTLNSFVVEHYKTQVGEGEFNTFQQWKAKNRTIKKGEKGWPIWGQPLGHRPEEIEQKGEPDEDFKYYPICYLFHESQTVPMEERNKKTLMPKIKVYA